MTFKGAARRITAPEIEKAAKSLGIEVATMRAVMAVESRGSGFDSKGRPVILFECHYFWRLLPQGVARDRAAKAGLAYPKWKPGAYPKDSYPRLAAAIEIDEEAAYRSVSIGLGQIMGANYKAAGCPSAKQMFQEAMESEANQLRHMCNFIKSKGLADDLRRRDWAGFAMVYNGPGYKKNRYDTLLANAYARWSRVTSKPRSELTVKDLREAGSKTIAGADAAKNGTIGTAVSGVVIAATQAQEIASQAQTAVDSIKQTADAVSQAKDSTTAALDVLGWVKTHPGVIIGGLAVLAFLYFAWRTWRGAAIAEEARLDDARTGVNERV